MTTLTEQIRQVAAARQKAADLAKMKRDSYLRWMAAEGGLLDATSEAALECAQAEQELRDMALTAYRETGNKKPVEGVGIQLRTRLEYPNNDALVWCHEHNMALTYDRKQFENIMKANLSTLPSFVTITEEAVATIAQDLEKAVK